MNNEYAKNVTRDKSTFIYMMVRYQLNDRQLPQEASLMSGAQSDQGPLLLLEINCIKIMDKWFHIHSFCTYN